MKKRGTRVLTSKYNNQIVKSKHSAIELSIGTIVIIVLAMTMLILGIVLVRSIMCGAIGLTGDVNNKVSGEINRLFGASGGEVVCIGGGEEAVALIPGKTNIVYCSVNADKEAEYEIKAASIKGSIVTESELQSWIQGGTSLTKRIAPSVEPELQKFLRLAVPNNAPKDLIIIEVEVYKDGKLIASPSLDFEVKKVGTINAAIC